MAEEQQSSSTSFPDLNAVIKDQQETIDTLSKKLQSESTSQNTPIFNTTPSAPEDPPNYILFISIGVIIYLLLFKRGR